MSLMVMLKSMAIRVQYLRSESFLRKPKVKCLFMQAKDLRIGDIGTLHSQYKSLMSRATIAGGRDLI